MQPTARGFAGTRMAARELAEIGVPSRLAWQVVEEHGTNALAALMQDPYTTLRPFRGYSFRWVAGCMMALPHSSSTPNEMLIMVRCDCSWASSTRT